MRGDYHSDMKKIELTQGQFAKVDDEDYDFLMLKKWHAKKNTNSFYAIHSKNNGNVIEKTLIHRYIMIKHGLLTDLSKEIDHIDHDGLNNQKSNLRACTHADNAKNKRPWRRSKYLGVSLSKDQRAYFLKDGTRRVSKTTYRYRVSIMSDGKKFDLGSFKAEKDAALAYNEGAIKHHGEFANLNVIDDA